MKPTHDILSLIITYGAFIIPLWELIYNRQNKGLKRINKLGWCAFAFGLICFSDGCLSNVIKEAEKQQSDSAAARNERADYLAKYQLQSSLDSSNKIAHSTDSILRVVYKLSIGRDNEGKVTINQIYITPQNTIVAPVRAELTQTPNKSITQLLNNGINIPLQYSINKDRTLTIPYMIGKTYAGSFMLNNREMDVDFDSKTGTFKKIFNTGSTIVFTANIPPRQSTTVCQIEAIPVLGIPDKKKTQKLINGDIIPLEYHVSGKDLKIKIPYMQGKDFAGGFSMDNISVAPVGYDKATGTLDISTTGTTGAWAGGNHLVFSANVPAK